MENKTMSESDDIFLSRAKEAHIQYERTKALFEKCHNGDAFSGISEQEEQSLLDELANDSLTFSNDMLIDMILNSVRGSSIDEQLLDIINKLKINNISDGGAVVGRAYPKYADGSYYIEIGRDIDKRIQILSDLFAVFFMYNENLNRIESIVLIKLLTANLQRYIKNEESNDFFNAVQKGVIFCDIISDNGFAEKYVSYSREIQEMAMAFLLGHEIGHHYFGHTSRKNDPEDVEPDIWKLKELKADSFGVEFAFNYLKNSYKSNESKYGIHQFAGLFIPLIASAPLNEKNKLEDTGIHPSLLKRMVLVQRMLGKMLDEKGFSEVKKMVITLCDMIDFWPRND